MTTLQVRTGNRLRFPDFIIGGAPKCGTTSLHFILGQNPAIGIPDQEIHYFDSDDPIGHPDFLRTGRNGLEWFEPDLDHDESLQWYASQFSSFAHLSCVGEDSTIYLHSQVAAKRIKQALPDVRMIFMLRDPVKRAYSQYWHLMGTSRVSCSFEDALSQHPSIVIGSSYTEYLRHYIDLFGGERVKICLLEDFLNDPQGFIDGVTDYLGVPRMQLDSEKSWFNRTRYPAKPAFHRQLNRLGRQIVKRRYHNHMGRPRRAGDRMMNKLHYYWFRYVTALSLTADRPPKMQPETERYLTRHLSARNDGLSDLLGRDMSVTWANFIG